MKVLTLTGKDFFGAGRAALRLHQGLSDIGIDAKMFVGDKRSADDTVVDIYSGKFSKGLIKLYRNLEDRSLKKYPNRHIGLFSAGKFGMNPLRAIQKFNPDIVHIHWINRGFMKLDYLAKIDVPVVISLHDMWTFTGGCHYDENCQKFKSECGQCLFLESDDLKDYSNSIYRRKREVYSKVNNLTVIGLSQWMANEAKNSALLEGKNVVNLPNGIDLDEFKPANTVDFKKEKGLSQDKTLVLFGAVGALDEPRKGFKFLKAALENLNHDKYELIIIGGSKGFHIDGFTIHNVGNIDDDRLMINYLSAADVVVVPSIQENLSNMIIESMACETPVVAFDIGGNSDMVTHKKNGFLCELISTSLVEGIEWCSMSDNNDRMSRNARESVEERFDIKKVSKMYLELYSEILSKKG